MSSVRPSAMVAPHYSSPSTGHVASLFEAIAAVIPQATAVVFGDDVRSWRQFDSRASSFAAFLTDIGVEAGDVVAQIMVNRPEYLEVMYGSLKVRAVPANINYRYQRAELAHVLSDAGTRVIVVDDEFGEEARAVAEQLNIEFVVSTSELANIVDRYEPAPPIRRCREDIFLSYTGGTTGLPRGVEYRLGDMTRNALVSRHLVTGDVFASEVNPVDTALRLVNCGQAPVVIPASPLMHSTGLVMTAIPTLAAGGTVVLLDGPFDAVRLLREVGRRKVTSIGWVGNAFARPALSAIEVASSTCAPFDLSTIRSIISAGLAWDAQVKAELLKYLPEDAVLIDSCGASEGGFIGTRRFARGGEFSSAGFDPAPGLRLLLEDGTDLSPGDLRPGLIAVPTIASGYRNDPDATKARFHVFADTQYVVPGDWGRRESDGTLILLGRGSGVINTGGEKVFAEEVEQVVRAHPGVIDCLVVGTPDLRFGHVVIALLVGEKDVGVGDIAEFVRSKLARYKAPRRVVHVQAIPRSPNGKPDYVAARRLADIVP